MAGSTENKQLLFKRSQIIPTHPNIPRKPLSPGAVAPHVASQPTRYISSTRGPGWTGEYIALALSTSAVTALIILLGYINNLRLSHWKSPVSPTTTVSILAAISRASLAFAISSCLGQAKWNRLRKQSDVLLAFERFDEASRGPWGSLWLIVWLTLVRVVAFEPSFQAIISFNGNIDSPDAILEARLSRSEFLDIGTYDRDDYAGWLTISTLPNETASLSVYNGFYNSSVAKKETASFICPTANCTWSPFTTLARYQEEGENFGTLQDHNSPIYAKWITNSLPNLNLTNISEGNGTQPSAAFMSATRLTNHQRTISFQNLSTTITTVQILKAADDYIRGDTIWEDTQVSATESYVMRGELGEETIASWSERDSTSYVGIDEWDRWNNNSLYTGSGDRYRSDLKLFIPHGDLQLFGLPENATAGFTLTQRAFFAEYMVWPLRGDTWGMGAPPAVQAIYQSTNISATFENAARKAGAAQEWAIRIHVEWPYIAVPLAAFITGLGFCIFSIFETYKLGLNPWKTDIIATLTHSVDAETRAQLRLAYRHGHLDKAVKAMIVSLEDVGNGLELKTKQD
ncbi:hypothetical protein GGR58DRAFT_529320 [Xylaria digitata]|nr:hypothetical protein GGR58DRAFT_529320 [Xylaria digitata]